MAYGEAIGTVGESTEMPCDHRLRTDKLAFTDRGSSTRTENHALQPFGAQNTRIPD